MICGEYVGTDSIFASLKGETVNGEGVGASVQACIVVSQYLVDVDFVAEVEHGPTIESITVRVVQSKGELDISREGYSLRNCGVTLIDARVNLQGLCNNESILVMDLSSRLASKLVIFKRYQDFYLISAWSRTQSWSARRRRVGGAESDPALVTTKKVFRRIAGKTTDLETNPIEFLFDSCIHTGIYQEGGRRISETCSESGTRRYSYEITYAQVQRIRHPTRQCLLGHLPRGWIQQ